MYDPKLPSEMDNKDISALLKMAAQLMELHGENEFRVRSYKNAAFRVGNTEIQLSRMNPDDLEMVDGVGKSMAGKISELLETGRLGVLEELLSKTPLGVVEMLKIKGLGPKKIRELWGVHHIESVAELLYACNENRLASLKGFGQKTQETLKRSIEFIIASEKKIKYCTAEETVLPILERLKEFLDSELVSVTGAMRRKSEIIERIEILVAADWNLHSREEVKDYESHLADSIVPVSILPSEPENFHYQLCVSTGSEKHLGKLNLEGCRDVSSEQEIYSRNSLPYIVPELREGIFEFDWIKNHSCDDLIAMDDLKGILHNHTTYSDGLVSLREMAVHCRGLGYGYLGICDHSQSATYAKGLRAENVEAQHKEIDDLNIELSPFCVFKGIESDILNDGSLDYPEEVLKKFDFIVASIHSNFEMSEEKATSRLIKAVENPSTTVLGHLTGRLLLVREGYPIDHKKVIDACAANNVIIELNSNPYRLDIDWRWIQYALSRNVQIAINPDAHNKEGLIDMYYGVCVARKGGLTRNMTFNAKPAGEVKEFFMRRKGIGLAD